MGPHSGKQPHERKILLAYNLWRYIEIPDLARYEQDAQPTVVEDDGSEPQHYQFNQYDKYESDIVGRRFSANKCLVLTSLMTALYARDNHLFWALIERRADRKKMRDIVEKFHEHYLSGHPDSLNEAAAQQPSSIQAFLMRRICSLGNDSTNKHVSKITAIMTKHGIEASKAQEIIHKISKEGPAEIAKQIASERLAIDADYNGPVLCSDEDYAMALNRQKHFLAETLSLINTQGAEEDFNAYLHQIAPRLMQEDSRRRRVYVDDFVPKYWYFQEERAFEICISSIRKDNMVRIHLMNNPGEGPHTGNMSHWVALGVIKDKSDRYKFAFFDPIGGLYLCSNQEQVKDKFNDRVGGYIRDNCIALITNQALAMDTLPPRVGISELPLSEAFNQCLLDVLPPSKTTARIPETSQSGVHANTPSGIPSNASQAAQALPQAPEPLQGDAHSDSLWHHICQKVAYAFSWLLAMVTCNLINLHYHDSKRDNKDDVSNTPPAAPETISMHADSNPSNDCSPNATVASSSKMQAEYTISDIAAGVIMDEKNRAAKTKRLTAESMRRIHELARPYAEYANAADYRPAEQSTVVEDDGSEPIVYRPQSFDPYIQELKGVAGSRPSFDNQMFCILYAKNKELFWDLMEQKMSNKVARMLTKKLLSSPIDNPLYRLHDLHRFTRLGSVTEYEGITPQNKYEPFKWCLISEIFSGYCPTENEFGLGRRSTRKHKRAIATMMGAHAREHKTMNYSGSILNLLDKASGRMEAACRIPLTEELYHNNSYAGLMAIEFARYRRQAAEGAISILRAIERRGAGEELNNYLSEIAPTLMAEDPNREQPYIDDFALKYWALSGDSSLEAFLSSMRPDKMVSLIITDNPVQCTWHRLLSIGIIKDRAGKYKFIIFSPGNEALLCVNIEQARKQFRTLIFPFYSCHALVINNAIGLETMPTATATMGLDAILQAEPLPTRARMRIITLRVIAIALCVLIAPLLCILVAIALCVYGAIICVATLIRACSACLGNHEEHNANGSLQEEGGTAHAQSVTEPLDINSPPAQSVDCSLQERACATNTQSATEPLPQSTTASAHIEIIPGSNLAQSSGTAAAL